MIIMMIDDGLMSIKKPNKGKGHFQYPAQGRVWGGVFFPEKRRTYHTRTR